ncbi:MAG TPA: TRAP transporter small permease, partial [Candidatus Acidoferrales bacterium]|nr:TRAP transporter small permease [Candidatus Acidoferrales bacterium]
MASLALSLAAGMRRLCTAAMAVAGLAAVVMMTLVTIEVLGRSFFNVSTLIADEMGSYLLVTLTFLGLAPTLRDGGFIRIDVYRARAGGRVRTALDAIIVILAIGYTATLDWYLWGLAANSYRLGTTSIQVARTPLWIPQGIMAVGGTLLLAELLAQLA